NLRVPQLRTAASGHLLAIQFEHERERKCLALRIGGGVPFTGDFIFVDSSKFNREVLTSLGEGRGQVDAILPQRHRSGSLARLLNFQSQGTISDLAFDYLERATRGRQRSGK